MGSRSRDPGLSEPDIGKHESKERKHKHRDRDSSRSKARDSEGHAQSRTSLKERVSSPHQILLSSDSQQSSCYRSAEQYRRCCSLKKGNLAGQGTGRDLEKAILIQAQVTGEMAAMQ